jgi:hypothetical protein
LSEIKSIIDNLEEVQNDFKQENYMENNSIDKNKQESLHTKSKETSVMLDRTKNVFIFNLFHFIS